MKIPSLANQTSRICFGVNHRYQPGIIGCTAATTPGHPEGDGFRVFHGWETGKKAVICGISPRPAALNLIDANIIKRLCNGDFIRNREINSSGLAAISERGIKKPNTVIRHCVILYFFICYRIRTNQAQR